MSNPPRKRSKRPNPAYKTAAKALHSSSPIAKADVHAFLFNALGEENWSKLTPDEQKELIDLMPPAYRIYEFEDGGPNTEGAGSLDRLSVDDANAAVETGERQVVVGRRHRCPLSPEFLMGDNYLRAATTRFKNDVEAGCYEAGWQTRAKKAMLERREGAFDDYLQEHAGELFDEGNDGEEENDEGVVVGVEEGLLEGSGGDWPKESSNKGQKKKNGSAGHAAREVDVPTDGGGGEPEAFWVDLGNGSRQRRSQRSK